MMRIMRERNGIDYVKPYTNSAWAKHDLDKMKEAFRYYRDKKERMKKELKEKGLWENMPEDYRLEMYALRTMLGILQVKITKCTGVFKKLQKEESLEQRRQQIRKKVNELDLSNISNKMDVGDQESFDKFCEYANEHIEEFL